MFHAGDPQLFSMESVTLSRPLYTLCVQSFRSMQRSRFAEFLRLVRRAGIRLIPAGASSNEFGHVRTYRVIGYDDAHRAYNLAYLAGLLEWLA